jgi:hypothetical protein
MGVESFLNFTPPAPALGVDPYRYPPAAAVQRLVRAVPS